MRSKYIKIIHSNSITTDGWRLYVAIRAIKTILENPRTSDKTKLKKIAQSINILREKLK